VDWRDVVAREFVLNSHILQVEKRGRLEPHVCAEASAINDAVWVEFSWNQRQSICGPVGARACMCDGVCVWWRD
jgi:hypothetical protein